MLLVSSVGLQSWKHQFFLKAALKNFSKCMLLVNDEASHSNGNSSHFEIGTVSLEIFFETECVWMNISTYFASKKSVVAPPPDIWWIKFELTNPNLKLGMIIFFLLKWCALFMSSSLFLMCLPTMPFIIISFSEWSRNTIFRCQPHPLLNCTTSLKSKVTFREASIFRTNSIKKVMMGDFIYLLAKRESIIFQYQLQK